LSVLGVRAGRLIGVASSYDDGLTGVRPRTLLKRAGGFCARCRRGKVPRRRQNGRPAPSKAGRVGGGLTSCYMRWTSHAWVLGTRRRASRRISSFPPWVFPPKHRSLSGSCVRPPVPGKVPSRLLGPPDKLHRGFRRLARSTFAGFLSHTETSSTERPVHSCF